MEKQRKRPFNVLNAPDESWAAYDRWLVQNEPEIRRRTLRPDTAFQAIVQAYLDGRRDAKDI